MWAELGSRMRFHTHTHSQAHLVPVYIALSRRAQVSCPASSSCSIWTQRSRDEGGWTTAEGRGSRDQMERMRKWRTTMQRPGKQRQELRH